jgi:ribosomal protein L24, bacterial/organelle
MKLHKNDNVEVIAGKDVGKRGEIVRVYADKDTVLVRGVNMVKKTFRPKSQQDRGGILDIEAPIHVSNVMIICKKCGKTRVGFKIEDGKKTRICRKCGEVL